MLTPSFEEWRPRSHWLVFAVSLIIVVTVIGLTLLWPVAGSAAGSRLMPLELVNLAIDGYQSPQRCRECHEAEFQAWSSTTHAQASFDPIFQTYLQKAQEPGECFSCHSTGYSTNTGQFVLAGVTCEACHGPYRAGHPEESMAIASSADFCGACHTSTLAEWQASRHGQMGVTCAACHEVHTQKTRVAVTTNALCAGCHHEQLSDSTHVTHARFEVQCIDCHLSRPAAEDAPGLAVSGHAATGHSFAVAVSACSDCHTSTPPPPKSQ